MTRSRIFGWSLPPGCTQRQIDAAFGLDSQCQVCSLEVGSCTCPECPVCHTVGNPLCYTDHGLKPEPLNAPPR